MPSLSDFLKQLSPDEVVEIVEPADVDYFSTALVLELEKRGRAPVIWLEQPKGFDMPVVSNLFADRGRIARMAGVAPGQFNAAWLKAEANPISPRIVSSGPVQEVVLTGSDVDAGRLPISRHFTQDAGRYISSGILVCKDPDTGVRNLSFQRLQLKAADRFGASLHSRGHIWDHLMRREARGENLEVAVVIGAHPAIYLAAGAKVAMEVDEYDLATLAPAAR